MASHVFSLNVYTPKVDKKERAVMVYFHGGAYIMGGGSSLFFGPAYLIEQDVVVVTFNFRYILSPVLSIIKNRYLFQSL